MIEFERDATTRRPTRATSSRACYAPPARVAVEVIDDETAGVVVVESGGSTLVVKCGNDACTTAGATDDYFAAARRSSRRPTVSVAVLTDGLTDVKSIKLADGTVVPLSYQTIGGYIPTQLFIGTVTVGAGSTTLHPRRRRQLPRRGLRARTSSSSSPAPGTATGLRLRPDRHRHRR